MILFSDKAQLETEKRMLQIEIQNLASKTGADKDASKRFQEEVWRQSSPLFLGSGG